MSDDRGRYLIAMENGQPRPGAPVHDTDHLDERCNTDDIADGYRTDLLLDAISKGHQPCEWCLGAAGGGSADREPVPA